MKTSGWIFFLLSWAGLIGLAGCCFKIIFSKKG